MDKPLNVYNTLTRSLETFCPQSERHVTMYHCGPTVYWTQHIGNLRAVVMADVVVRTLTYFGYEVELVRNYTDVGHLTSDEDSGEDKIDRAARKEGQTPVDIANYYIQKYERDVARLNVAPPSHTPRATNHIESIISMISQLQDKGFTYTTTLAVYFDTSKISDYTKLSRQNLAETREGAGTGDIQDPDKKNPHDFALWFYKRGSHAEAMQTWHSPFKPSDNGSGEGFPGWHIECSAMSRQYLGTTLDIHMGGIEHVPVHHTNEIAQSEAANRAELARYWLHNEHLLVDSAKMSKSQGTGYSLDEIIERGIDPLVLRYLFLQSHYRSKQNFTWESLSAAQNGLSRLYRSFADLGDEDGTVSLHFKELFLEALADDFNTSRALGVLIDMFKSDISGADKRATVIDFDSVFGLQFSKKYSLFKKLDFMDIPEKIRKLCSERDRARSNKDWTSADRLREEIKSHGYIVQDDESGTHVYKS